MSYWSYFAWGEISLKSDYSWSTYKWCNGYWDALTKYNSIVSLGKIDNKTELDLSDDAAFMNWGGSGVCPQMPIGKNYSWYADGISRREVATLDLLFPASGTTTSFSFQPQVIMMKSV